MIQFTSSFMWKGWKRTCVWNEGCVSLNYWWQLKGRQEIPLQCFILHFLVCLEQSRELFVGMPLAGTPAPVKRKKSTKLIGKLTHEGKICKTAHLRIVWISTWISAFKISHSVWLKSQSRHIVNTPGGRVTNITKAQPSTTSHFLIYCTKALHTHSCQI